MAATTTTQIPAGVQAFYDRNLLERATPELVHDKYGQMRNIPKGGSDSIKFRRYNGLTAATTPLTEGVTPSGSQLSITDVTATVAQYGDFVTITDTVNLTVEDNVITEATDVLGEQAGDTVDQVYRDVLNAGTNVFYAGSIDTTTIDTRVEVASAPLAKDLDACITALKGQKAKKFTSMIQGSNKINTYPIRPAFMAITHTDKVEELEALTGWKSVEEYASQSEVDLCEAGAYKSIRFVETTNAKVFTGAGAAGVDVYSTLILGKNAYGVVGIKGNRNIQTIVKPLGSGDDPLNQRATVGWKVWATAKILNDAFMIRYESA
ncbi:N4-gp56 family major capsid protein [Sulfurimonas sp.]|uniref:N4-gp56 family major capsid protein n=1 Tax=Sulfurimonas sp. TaxID=2022749 RepID=UPI0035645290